MGRGRWWSEVLRQFAANFIHDYINALQHIMVPEPEYKIAVSAKPFRTRVIVRCCITVLTTIQLDDELRLRAEKIHDELA